MSAGDVHRWRSSQYKDANIWYVHLKYKSEEKSTRTFWTAKKERSNVFHWSKHASETPTSKHAEYVAYSQFSLIRP